ncbi:MAG: ABC transporter permease [Polyangia bacterium]
MQLTRAVLAALHRKLFRDLAHLKGQVLTISLVVACGIASFVAMRGNFASLEQARARFYEEQRFADVFVQLERAPGGVAADLEALPGVARIETRVVEPAMLPLEDLPEPVRGTAASLPREPTRALNAIHLRDGRLPDPDHADEAVLLQAFADAHHVRTGDRVPVVLNGKLRPLLVVGIASSPEYVMAIAPGSLSSDPERFAVVWMSQDALAAAFRMEGAFNDVAVALRPGASQAGIIDGVDRVLVPWGGLGAYGRDRQPSNHMLDGELTQLSSMATILPAIFLGVAALLVNLVLSRLVFLQQPEIATLKALGYSNRQVGLHFLELVLVIGCAGAVVGIALGGWLGGQLIGLYARYFKLPSLVFRFDVRDSLLAVGISFAAAATGAFGSVRRAVRMPPAEAMRPPAPARYRRSLVDRLRLGRLVGPAAHMVVRELERRPWRTVLSSLAIAAATALSVVGGWYYDGVEKLFYTQFHQIMREDAAVTFVKARPERAIGELAHVPGVLAAEGVRLVPVRFRSGWRHRDAVIWGYPDGIEMRRLRDVAGREVPLPPEGIVLTDMLARVLEVRVGDAVEVELHEGARDRRSVVVAGLVSESFGLQGHMRMDTLRGWLGESPHVSLALLRLDPTLRLQTESRLKELPSVVDVTRRSSILQRFREQSGNMIVTMAMIIALFAGTITVGVVYNNARVALSMRGRDLASLRVLGFTRAEISSVLIGEQLIQVLAALPIGLVLGRGLVQLLSSLVDPETYRLPIGLTPRSYAFAAAVTLIAATVSALLVRRRLDHLDLIAVLKTRE